MNFEEMVEFIQSLFSDFLGRKLSDGDCQRGYYELGVDSAMLMQVVSSLEKQLKLKLPPTLLFEFTNICELAEHLNERYGSRIKQDEPINVQAVAEEEKADTKQSEEYEKTTHVDVTRLYQNFHGSKALTAKTDDIAVIGMSARYPGAESLTEYWENLLKGKDCITEVPEQRWRWQEYENRKFTSEKGISKWGGFITDPDCFDASFFYISPREAALLDPQERLFLQASWEAIEDAGYTPENIVASGNSNKSRKVGVYAGVMHKDYVLLSLESIQNGANIPISLSHSAIANRVSYYCGFNGPSITLDTACSSSLSAVHLGLMSLINKESDVVLAGGVNLSLHPNKYVSYGMSNMHSSDGYCHAFGEGGDGYVSSEGVGVLVLKPLAKAEQDGDHIYAVIKGSAINHVGKVSGIMVPDPAAQSEVIDECIKNAGINPENISYVEAHGTGTSLGDPIEIEGLSRTYAKYTSKKQFCAIGSVKTNIGHAESAAGVSGLTKAILQLHHRILVPSLHSAKLNPHIEFQQTPFYIQRKTQPWVVDNHRSRLAGVSSFGATGANGHVILQEYTLPLTNDEPDFLRPYIIPLSAKTIKHLKLSAIRLAEFIAVKPDVDIRSLSYTLQTGRQQMTMRLALLSQTEEDILLALDDFIRGRSGSGRYWVTDANGRHDKSKVTTTQAQVQQVEEWVHAQKLKKIVEFWIQGYPMDWASLWPNSKPRKMSLPTYPFSRTRHWLPKIENSIDSDTHKAFGNSFSGTRIESLDLRTEESKEDTSEASLVKSKVSANKIELSVLSESDGMPIVNKENSLTDFPAVEPADIKANTEPNQTPHKSDVNSGSGTSYSEPEVARLLATSLADALYMDENDVEKDENFTDLGLDSIVGVEWIRAINKQFDIQLDSIQLYEHASINLLASYIRQKLAAEDKTNGNSDDQKAPASDIQAFLLDSLAAALYMSPGDLDPVDSLLELGLDSIVGVEWIREINKELGTDIDSAKLYELSSISALSTFLNTELNPLLDS